MGLIKTPEGIDFEVQNIPLTDKERDEISKFIKASKNKTKRRSKSLENKQQLVKKKPKA